MTAEEDEKGRSDTKTLEVADEGQNIRVSVVMKGRPAALGIDRLAVEEWIEKETTGNISPL